MTARRCPTRNLSFNFDPVTGAGEFKTIVLLGPDGLLGTADDVATTLDTPGQIGIRVTATDPGGLSVTDTFFIDVVPPNSPPNADDDYLHHARERRADHAALDRRAAQRHRPQRRSVHRGGGDRTDQRDADVPRGRDLRLHPQPQLRRNGHASPTRTPTAPAR